MSSIISITQIIETSTNVTLSAVSGKIQRVVNTGASSITVTLGTGGSTVSVPAGTYIDFWYNSAWYYIQATQGSSPTFAGLTVDTNTLFVDPVNHRVSIGTTTPNANLDIQGTDALFVMGNGETGNTQFRIKNYSDYVQIQSMRGGWDYNKSLAINPLGGYVGIGATSPGYQLTLSTDSAAKPSSSTWTVSSDIRLKEGVVFADLDRCYEIIKTLPLKRYTWKNDVYTSEQVSDRSKLGWIANDAKLVFPKAVSEKEFIITPEIKEEVTPAIKDEDGNIITEAEYVITQEKVSIPDCLDLNADQIYAAMYGALQKAIEKIELLESKVAALESAINQSEALG